MIKFSFKNRSVLDLCLIAFGIIGLNFAFISILLKAHFSYFEANIIVGVFCLGCIWAGAQPRKENEPKLDNDNEDILDSDFMHH